MRKLLSVLLIAVSFLSCSKSGDTSSSNNGNIPTDGFRVGTTTYTYSSCVRYAGSTSLKAYSTDGSLFITFLAFPTVSGSYQIINGTTTSTGMAANQIAFEYIATTGTYKSVATTAVSATVTVTNGIIKVTIPETDVSLSGSGTLKFAANITEK